MKIINKIIAYLTVISLILTTLISVIDYFCFDINFYHNQYIINNTKEVVGTDDENLYYITTTIFDYLKDKTDDLDIVYEHNDNLEKVFEDIELIHMSDVKDLYRMAILIRNIAAIIFVVGIIYIFVRKIRIKREFITILLLMLFGIGLIVVSCLVDFDTFWTSFHKVFFTKNDYWLLDPTTCILVNLYKEEFFFALCFRISIVFIIFIIIYLLLVWIYERKAIN